VCITCMRNVYIGMPRSGSLSKVVSHLWTVGGGLPLQALQMVPWHSLYKHSLYVTKFIRTFFIQDRFYTGQSLYRTNFIRGQNLYEDKVYTGTKFIRDKVYTVTKFIRGQSLYKLFSYCTWIKGYKVNVKNMYIIQSNHIRVCNCYCYCLLIIPWIYDQG
jgi:hypothetical protein